MRPPGSAAPRAAASTRPRACRSIPAPTRRFTMNERKRWIRICLLAIAALTAGVAWAEKKVTLCHYPPGNPANYHTISVGEAAVSAHVGHGDEIGACPSGCVVDAALCD